MTSYLLTNWLEISVIFGAILFSRHRAIPLFLFFYCLIMTVTFKTNQDQYEYLNRNFDFLFYHIQDFNDKVEAFNIELIDLYMFEGVTMLMCAAIVGFAGVKLALLAAVVVSLQAAISFLYAASIAIATEFSISLNFIEMVHNSTQSIFVILYCVIAWMCAYYSRKE